MKFEINASQRKVQGTGASRRLRRAGRVPGILYGGDAGAVNIELDHKELLRNLHNEKFHASILTLKLDGGAEQVLLRAFNMHPVKSQVQHVDFQRVSKDKKIHMEVPLHFVNAANSPGVKEQAGVVTHVLNELDIECFPDDLPEYIEVDLGGIAVGKSIHARELTLPKGVHALLHKDDDPVVATCTLPALVTEEEVAAEPVPAAGEVPTTEQTALEKPGEGAPAAPGDKAKAAAAPGEKAKAADKGTDKGADKSDKKEKK
jgi:large subunit ribosomal protein L25